MCGKLPSACELISPFLDELKSVEGLPSWLHDKHKDTVKTLEDVLAIAKTDREPLRLQRAAPTPLKQLNPVFDADFQPGDASLRDPDRSRAEAQKLRRQLKKEHKGAIRELRKDSQALASVRAAETRDRLEYLEGRGKRAVRMMEEQEATWKSQKREKKRGVSRLL